MAPASHLHTSYIPSMLLLDNTGERQMVDQQRQIQGRRKNTFEGSKNQQNHIVQTIIGNIECGRNRKCETRRNEAAIVGVESD